MNLQAEKNSVRWGILGCANVARNIMVPAIQRSKNGKIVAVAEEYPPGKNLSIATEFAKKYGIGKVYGSYDELLNDPDIQAIYVPQPNSLHKKWTIRSAQKGKHVLCEKPLAVNARQAQEMVKACRDAGVLLMEGFAHRFHPQNLYVKKLVEQGRLGKILRITSIHCSGRPNEDDIRLSKQLGGGVLGDKGCYCINTARFILGAEPISVFAQVWYGQTGVDERVVAEITFPDDAVLQFDSSFALAQGVYQQGYTVFGEKGWICLPEGFVQLPTARQGRIVDTHIFVTDETGETERIKIAGDHQWKLEVEYFSDCILTKKQLDFPAENGISNTIVMDAIFTSSKKAASVSV